MFLLRHLTARLALGWRIRLTQHLLKNYLRSNVFYKVIEYELFISFVPSSIFFLALQAYCVGQDLLLFDNSQLSIICTI